MDVKRQIKEYDGSQSNPNCSDMQALHRLMIQKCLPGCLNLWFEDGKRNSENKTVSNLILDMDLIP